MSAVTFLIDDETLFRLEKVAGGSGKRSEAIRQAVLEYVTRTERLSEEHRESEAIRRNRRKIAREARAVVREQARR